MSKRVFKVEACWDEDAQIWYSISDIVGLHIEAATLEEFEGVMFDAAADLIIANHLVPDEITLGNLADALPAILWQRPEGKRACA